MKKIRITFYEIENVDVTAIKLETFNNEGKLIDFYTNFESNDSPKIWSNQSVYRECSEERFNFLLDILELNIKN